MTSDTAVAADELIVAFGEHVVLDAVTFDLPLGEGMVVTGPNGAGKSTLLKTILGFQPVTEGSVTVCGYEAGSLSARAHVAMVPDEPVFYRYISVGEQLEYLAALSRVDDPVTAADRAARRFDLEDRWDEVPAHFSRGWRQRLSLACGFARECQVLCIDEPVVGLDTRGRAQLVEALREHIGEGGSFVVATHEPELLGDLATREIRIEEV